MSRFPRVYAESTIARMNKKLALPQETMSLLYDYFEAFANLYQLLPLKDAYKIISKQNKGLITLDEFIAFSEIARHENHFYYILAKDELYLDAPKEEPIDREIVHSSLVDVDYEYYYNMADHQAGKPLKILPKQELLKYKEEMYIADTPYVRAMMDFLRTRLKMSEEEINYTISDFILIITCDDKPFDAVSKMLDRKNILMTKSQLEDFIKLFTDLSNNTRMPQNRGFTPPRVIGKSWRSKSYQQHFLWAKYNCCIEKRRSGYRRIQKRYPYERTVRKGQNGYAPSAFSN